MSSSDNQDCIQKQDENNSRVEKTEQTVPAAETPSAFPTPSELKQEPIEPTVRPAVLFVDDEPSIRRLATTVLTNAGFRVLLAENGVEAIRIFRDHIHEIDLTILDLTMPLMNGLDAFSAIRDLKSNARVILSSGYFQGDIHLESNLVFLRKPYKPDELLEAIRLSINIKNNQS